MILFIQSDLFGTVIIIISNFSKKNKKNASEIIHGEFSAIKHLRL